MQALIEHPAVTVRTAAEETAAQAEAELRRADEEAQAAMRGLRWAEPATGVRRPR